MKVKNYRDLDVWKKGLNIVDKIYQLTQKFPCGERYGLAAQIQRAAVSIPSNIAEGFGRHYKKEYEQFLYIALGSCGELETQLIICERRKYITKKELEDLQEDIDHESRMLMNLIKSISQFYGSRTTSDERRNSG
jgi:four helix bundle protein